MATADDKTEVRSEEESSLDIKEIIYLCLSNWYWIIISVIICLGLGVLYILRTPPVYTRSAQIVIKEDAKNSKSMSQFDEFASMGLFRSNTNLLNEIATIQSPDMMERVVRKLNLDMNYATEGRFHNDVLYGTDLPIKVNMYTLDPDEIASFKITLGADSSFVLTDFLTKEEDYRDRVVKGRFGQLLKTPLGEIVVRATEYYSPEFDEPILVSRTSVKKATYAYVKQITISQSDEKSGVVDMSIDDVSTQRADDIINTLIECYNANWINDKNEIAISTRNFIDERLKSLFSELGDVDDEISSYKSSNLVPDLQLASDMYMRQANLTSNEILELNTQLQMANYVKNYLTDPNNKAQLIPANTGFESNGLNTQISNYNELVLDRNNLAANSSESNPLVVDMDTSIKEMRLSILTAIDNQIENIKGQIKSKEHSESEALSKISSNPQQAKFLLSVERQQKVKESLYLYLLQKREENELSQTFSAYNTRVIMVPQGSDFPTAPRRLRILFVAFVLGLAIPIGIIILNSTLNTKVRGRKDLDVITAPFVGEIPQYRGHKKGGGVHKKKGKNKGAGDAFVVVQEGNRNVINEAFRVIRANLEFMIGNDKVIALTSANPDSGKTFITYNLAASFAIKGKKVLAIDLDLRKGSLSVYADSPAKGVTDYLVGHVDDLDSIIVSAPQTPALSILPKGTTPPNPTELLYSPRFAEMMQKLRQEYDIIFVDCPPVEIVADASIINKEVDMTMFIIRAGLFERGMLPEIQKFYTQNKYKNIAIALNGTEASTHYGQRYGYRYGYHYGYHYGNYAGYGNGNDK